MAETPTCPSCGYDQQGVIDSWKTECPLTGICSECGFEFRWGALIMPLLRDSIQLFDCAVRPNVHCLLHSILGCYRPWKLWPEATRGGIFRLRRSLVVAAVGLVATHALLVVAFQVGVAVYFIIARATNFGYRVPIVEAAYAGGWPYKNWESGFWETDTNLGWLTLILLWSITSAIAGITPPFAQVSPRIAWRHWVRMWLHCIPTLPIVAALIGLAGLLALLPFQRQHTGEWVLAVRLVILTAWFTTWWALTFKQYMGIPKPWLQGFGSTFLGGLLGFVLLLLLAWTLDILARGI